MKLFPLILASLAVATLLPVPSYAEVTDISASPNPVKQGTTMVITARVDRAGPIYFFFKGRPFGKEVRALRPGTYSTSDTVPRNTVPAGRTAIKEPFSAQQFGHRYSESVTVSR